MVDQVRMRAWSCRASKSIKKINMKAELVGSEIEQEKACTDVLPGSKANAQLELLVVKKHHDHFFLQVN